MRRQHGKDDRPANGGGVASSLVIKIKEKRKGWRAARNKPELLKKEKRKRKLCGQNHKFNDQQTMSYNMNKKSKGKKKNEELLTYLPQDPNMHLYRY